MKFLHRVARMDVKISPGMKFYYLAALIEVNLVKLSLGENFTRLTSSKAVGFKIYQGYIL